MSTIIEFTQKEKQHLINQWTQGSFVGDGYESTCYQINGYVYKVLNNNSNTHYDESIDIDEMNTPSFLFPEEIYTSNNEVFAYKTRYIQNEMYKKRIYAGIFPDFNKIRAAIPAFVKDIFILSKNNIKTTDISWNNLLFDGVNIYAIDTLHYEKEENLSQTDIYKWNISHLQMAMIEFTKVCEDTYRKRKISLSNETRSILLGLPYYIGEVSKQIAKENYEEIVQK